MYRVDSLKAEEFICHEEIEATLQYAEENKNNIELKRVIEDNETINNSIRKIDVEVKKLEDSITSITKTITQINTTLEKFNFTNFKLKENEDHLTYSIIRPDGSNASSTLVDMKLLLTSSISIS